MISIQSSGTFNRTEAFLEKMSNLDIFNSLSKYAAQGVAALADATPVDTGLTSALWDYEVKVSKTGATITWTNAHVISGVSVAIILQYGHGTGTGGYVQGRDYINPAMKPIFDRIADGVWKEVKSA